MHAHPFLFSSPFPRGLATGRLALWPIVMPTVRTVPSARLYKAAMLALHTVYFSFSFLFLSPLPNLVFFHHCRPRRPKSASLYIHNGSPHIPRCCDPILWRCQASLCLDHCSPHSTCLQISIPCCRHPSSSGSQTAQRRCPVLRTHALTRHHPWYQALRLF